VLDLTDIPLIGASSIDQLQETLDAIDAAVSGLQNDKR
jgi:hypothetical protein